MKILFVMKIVFLMSLLISLTPVCSQNIAEQIIIVVIQENNQLNSNVVVADSLYELNKDYLFDETRNVINNYELTSSINENKININNTIVQTISSKEFNELYKLSDSINLSNNYKKIDVYKLISEKYCGKKYCVFSKPLLTNDRKIALIQFKVISGYNYGSFSWTYLMKNRKGVWSIKEVLEIEED